MFRDRPLTWLFLIATVLLNVVLLGVQVPEYSGIGWRLIMAFLFGQSALLGAWLAVGQAHRLARGACFTLGVLGVVGVLQALISNRGYEAESLGTGIAVFYAYASTAFLSTAVCCFFLNVFLASRKLSLELKFPLVELFGWTIVVAIGALVAREGSFSILVSAPGPMILPLFLLSAMQAGFLVALLAPSPHFTRRTLSIAIIAELVFGALLYWLLKDDTELVWTHLYIAIYLLVKKLDSMNHQSSASEQIQA